jgi:hypothetical protein
MVASCLRFVRRADLVSTRASERRAPLGRSLTIRAGSAIVGCDGSSPPGGGWCGGVVGRLEHGRLVDPRLTLTCHDRRGRRIAFGWIDPLRRARWVVVGGGRAAVRYEVGGGVPVRASTSDVGLESAAFEIAEYGPDGTELERRRVAMRPAG